MDNIVVEPSVYPLDLLTAQLSESELSERKNSLNWIIANQLPHSVNYFMSKILI